MLITFVMFPKYMCKLQEIFSMAKIKFSSLYWIWRKMIFDVNCDLSKIIMTLPPTQHLSRDPRVLGLSPTHRPLNSSISLWHVFSKIFDITWHQSIIELVALNNWYIQYFYWSATSLVGPDKSWLVWKRGRKPLYRKEPEFTSMTFKISLPR